MNIKQSYTVKQVSLKDRDHVTEFMMRVRKEVFPMLSQDELPHDLLHFEETYLNEENAIIYVAYDHDKEVVGTIGVQPYDGRFSRLEKHYGHLNTAEIVKCYIDPEKRRSGVGTMLLKQARCFCNEVGYDMLYLHTHPFLPGAVPFWKANGFNERFMEEDPVWQTIHMDMKL